MGRAPKTFSTSPRNESAHHVRCPICDSDAMRGAWRAEGFVFRRCVQCGLLRQDPQPDIGSVIARYDASYLDYELKNHFVFRDLALAALRDVGIDVVAGLRVLDVGCATGALAAALRDAGADACGVEVCLEAADYGRRAFSLDIHGGTLETAPYPRGSFDLVHAAHVIEHLNDPRNFIRTAAGFLKTDGKLVITTPNEASFQGRLTRGAWRSAIGDHLFLFSKRTLGDLLKLEGFVVERLSTWGGWPLGARPGFFKGPLDRAAKKFGFGDVMVVLASRNV